MKLSVKNMTSSNGNLVPNQFVIDDGNKTVFQSYNTIIAVKKKDKVTLDSNALEYSNTTLKYVKQFLNPKKKKKALYSKIKNGYYSTADLN